MDEVDALIAEVVPPGCCVSEQAIIWFRPLFGELIRLRKESRDSDE